MEKYKTFLEKIIVLNNTNSIYDKEAQQIILKYLKGVNKSTNNNIIRLLKKNNISFDNYTIYAYINSDFKRTLKSHYLKFRLSIDEIYQDALNYDDESPQYIMIKKNEENIIYSAIPDSDLFAGFTDKYNENGFLKKEIIEQSVKNIEREFNI